jgi:hypothetical protein
MTVKSVEGKIILNYSAVPGFVRLQENAKTGW